jgi:hypothetical protein
LQSSPQDLDKTQLCAQSGKIEHASEARYNTLSQTAADDVLVGEKGAEQHLDYPMSQQANFATVEHDSGPRRELRGFAASNLPTVSTRGTLGQIKEWKHAVAW